MNTRIVPINSPLDIKIKDENDQKVRDNAESLLKSMPKEFDESLVRQRFPITYSDPLSNLINRETDKYN